MRLFDNFSDRIGRRSEPMWRTGGVVAQAKLPKASEDDEPVAGESPSDFRPSTSYWRGLSGRLYRHSAHTTIFCPPPSHGTYVLVRRDERGRAVPLYTGVAASSAATLNLAHIRHRAVTLGVTEVHLYPVRTSGSAFAMRRIARDLRAAFAT